MTAYELEVWARGEVRASPRDQLVALMNHHEQALCNFLNVLLEDRDLAMDCAQDTFMRAYQQLERGKPVTAAWLYKVARNRAMDEFRHRKHERHQSEPLDVIAAEDETEGTRAVRRILEQLCPDDREVLYLFSVDKFETAQIAAMLGVQPGAVRMRLVRARERFRALYGCDT